MRGLKNGYHTQLKWAMAEALNKATDKKAASTKFSPSPVHGYRELSRYHFRIGGMRLSFAKSTRVRLPSSEDQSGRAERRPRRHPRAVSLSRSCVYS